jgi:hypothetical protein
MDGGEARSGGGNISLSSYVTVFLVLKIASKIKLNIVYGYVQYKRKVSRVSRSVQKSDDAKAGHRPRRPAEGRRLLQ